MLRCTFSVHSSTREISILTQLSAEIAPQFFQIIQLLMTAWMSLFIITFQGEGQALNLCLSSIRVQMLSSHKNSPYTLLLLETNYRLSKEKKWTMDFIWLSPDTSVELDHKNSFMVHLALSGQDLDHFLFIYFSLGDEWTEKFHFKSKGSVSIRVKAELKGYFIIQKSFQT